MSPTRFKLIRSIVGTVSLASVLVSNAAYAAGSNMPWEQPLQQLLDSLQGPVAKIVGVAAIVLAGLALAFGESSGMIRKTIQIVFGITIAFSASTFFLSFFQFGGGALL